MSRDDEDDESLFRRTAGKVRRLENDRVSHVGRRPHPVPRQGLMTGPVVRESFADPDADAPAAGVLLFYRPGIPRKVIRRLRRGQIPVAEELDLHGLRVHEAADALGVFLSECTDRGLRCVRIVHGKGFGSGTGRSVLKENVARWLELHGNVVAFSSAKPVDGGTGAVYVLLRA